MKIKTIAFVLSLLITLGFCLMIDSWFCFILFLLCDLIFADWRGIKKEWIKK